MPRVASRFLVVALATLLATGWLTFEAEPTVAAGSGSVALTSLDVAIGETFDTLANTGTVNTALPTGWFLSESGTSSNNNDAYQAGTGSNNAGDVYSFGALGDTDRAFGGLLSGSLTPTVGAAFTNSTGEAIGSVDISYAGEAWRLGADPALGTPPRGADRLDFQYSLDATSLTTGTWTDADALDFVSGLALPTGAKDGNNAANRIAVSSSIASLSIANGATFWIRWSDFNVPSSDDGLAIDDFTITPRGGSVAPSLSISDVSQAEGDLGSVGFRFTVSLSAPAGAGGVTFDVGTVDGTADSTASEDYSTTNLVDRTIEPGETSTMFSVPVTGDTAFEPDETFFVNISGVTGAIVADGQGLGTILNDDEGDPCTQPFTPIYQIQGTTNTPATMGNVTTQGVVVGDFEGPDAVGFLGFYIQDPSGDGNAATSDGIYIFTNAAIKGVSEGDEVRVTGFARNRFNETSISGANDNNAGVPLENILICSTGNPLPAAAEVTLPVTAVGDLEKYEGMRVIFPQALVIAEYFNYDRFGEIVLALPLAGESRPFTGTAIDEPGVGPGSPANQRTAANNLRRITLDDGLNGQNPEFTRHPNGDAFSLSNRFRGGDKVQDAIGVLGFAFSQYRIQPTAPATYIAVNERPTEPEPVGGDVRVAAMNTLNFFVTGDAIQDDSGTNDPDDDVCGGNGNLECRGWDTNQPTELTRQRDKLVRALAGIDADVLGLNELENSPLADPLTDAEGIVPALNTFLEEDVYAAIETGIIGTDAIRVGLIYKHQVVTPIGAFEVLDSSDDERFIDTRSRPALAQTFEVNETGARFTVVVNHLKSKGSACTDDPTVPNDFNDPDRGDGQGNCNLTRKAAAEALVDWVATDPTGSGDPDFLIMGDLNSYAQEDPIDAVKAGADGTAGTGDDWTNLIARFGGTYAYSYVFDGQAGYLDHALANASIVSQVTGATEWHINADEPDILDYDTSFKSPAQDALYELNGFRTSDHDPVIVGLDLVNDAPTIEVSAGNACTEAGGTFMLAVDDTEVAAGDLTLSLEDNSNADLVTGVTFGGSGGARTANVAVASGQSGTAVLTIAVDDGFQSATTTITVRVGSDADDTLVGDAGADLVIGRQGTDQLSGNGGADVLCGGNGDDALSGGAGNDALEGERGDDSLSGGAGDDILRGGQGDDSLTGGLDADAFSGGPGADTNTDMSSGEGDTTDGT
jgi:predicted extracellular nuclease